MAFLRLFFAASWLEDDMRRTKQGVGELGGIEGLFFGTRRSGARI